MSTLSLNIDSLNEIRLKDPSKKDILPKSRESEDIEIGENIARLRNATQSKLVKLKRKERSSAGKEIEEGLLEYQSAPRSREGVQLEMRDSYSVEVTEDPLRKLDLEKNVLEYMDQNFFRFLPLFIAKGYNKEEVIKQFGLSDELLSLSGYHRVNGEWDTLRSSDLLTLAYLQDTVRIDGKGGLETGIAERYYFRPIERYLCRNDFGMQVWDEEIGTMKDGRVDELMPFVQFVAQQFHRIGQNIDAATYQLVDKTRAEVIEAEVCECKVRSIAEDCEQYPRNKQLILEAVPLSKLKNHLHFHYAKIARLYGLMTSDPVADYKFYKSQGHKRIEQLLQKPSDAEKVDTSIPFVWSDFYKKPVIASERFNRAGIIHEAKKGVGDFLSHVAVQSNDELKSAYQTYSCSRGPQSPYYYNGYEVNDFLLSVGVDQAKAVLSKDDRTTSTQMVGYKYLRAMGYDISRFDPEHLKKQLYEAYKLDSSQVWEYLQRREQLKIEESQCHSDVTRSHEDWLELVGTKKARNFFREGKRMYWLAQQVYMKNSTHPEDDRFYNNYYAVQWDCYDLTKADVPDQKLSEYLETHKGLIISLLSQKLPKYYDSSKQEVKATAATLGLIIQALDSGRDIRGVAIANDKQRYLEGLIAGNGSDDLECALKDWPTEWREAITLDEINMYYEYASDYVQLDPNGLAKYAAWRGTPEGREWTKLLGESPKHKSDLDFRICLGKQAEEVRGWYKVAAEYVGHETMQNYLLRLNVMRDDNGRLTSWHDVLFWVPNIQKLKAADIKSVLSGIQNMDENQEFIKLLPRYKKHRDPFLDQACIPSLRELKKRIVAIESNIDLSTLPPELLEITTAPGFNVSAFEEIRERAGFADLFEKRMDISQPFKPQSRIFAGRSLTESLKEGLGSKKLKIRGTARSDTLLFHALAELLRGRKIGKRKMEVYDLLDNVPVDLEEKIICLLQDQGVNIGPIIEAQIHAKSDPEGWVCGNYTDCCMSFGESNNNDYMFNPSTQYFTVKYNGRIVAQSVVVDGRDTREDSDVVILDNIEIAKNYLHLSPLFAKAYQVFWAEYTNKPVKVGAGHLDLIPPGGKLEENQYKSKTRLYSSDATGTHIYDLPKMKGIKSMEETITFANVTERDAKLIAELEAAAYPSGMVQGKAHILDIIQKQRDLEVSGAAASFLIRNGSEIAGYMLMLPEESEVNNGEKVAHVYDMVVLPKFQGTGLVQKMMERVLDVATAYKVSIEAEARASTSHKLLTHELTQKWLARRGFYLTTDEKKPQYLGGEDFYFVRLENRNHNE